MRQSGDSIKMVEGAFSGTLSFLLNSVAAGMPFSEAVAQAAELGYCEPDPRDDITFTDLRRKANSLSLQPLPSHTSTATSAKMLIGFFRTL